MSEKVTFTNEKMLVAVSEIQITGSPEVEEIAKKCNGYLHREIHYAVARVLERAAMKNEPVGQIEIKIEWRPATNEEAQEMLYGEEK